MSEIDARRLDKSPPTETLLMAAFDRGNAADSSSFNRSPTVSSGATFIAGAVDFDATSNAVITYPDATELETPPLSVFGWWRNDAATNANGISIITKASIATSPSNSYRGWYLSYVSGTTGSLGLRVSIVENTFNKFHTWGNRTLYQDGVWRHIGFTLATVGATPKLYVNGVLQTVFYSGGGYPAQAATTIATSDPVRLAGRGYSEQNTYLNGALDDVIILGRELSAADVMEIYRSTLHKTRP